MSLGIWIEIPVSLFECIWSFIIFLFSIESSMTLSVTKDFPKLKFRFTAARSWNNTAISSTILTSSGWLSLIKHFPKKNSSKCIFFLLEGTKIRIAGSYEQWNQCDHFVSDMSFYRISIHQITNQNLDPFNEDVYRNCTHKARIKDTGIAHNFSGYRYLLKRFRDGCRDKWFNFFIKLFQLSLCDVVLIVQFLD